MYRWLLLSTLLMVACGGRGSPLLVVLDPDSASIRPEPSAPMLDELRALPGLQLLLSASGCQHPGASHRLRLTWQHTETTLITAAELIRCADQARRVQNFVQPRGSNRNPGRAVAFWVAQQLG